MTVLSGKYGAVNTTPGTDTVFNWVINETTTPSEFRTSNTRSGTGRREGVYDYTGSFEGYAGVPPFMPSEYFDFLGYTAPTTGARGVAGITHQCINAIVDEVSITWDWGTCDLLKWALRFSSGEPGLILRASNGITDNAIPDPPTVCGTKVTLTANNTVWPNIVTATLTITANNPTFVNSSTQCTTGRRPGIIDWNAAIVEQASGPNATLGLSACNDVGVGGDTVLRLWVDGASYWDLWWAHLVSISDLRVDNDTGAIIEQTNNFAMNGFDVGGSGNGRIARPGEDGASNPYWWPTEIVADTLPFTVP